MMRSLLLGVLLFIGSVGLQAACETKLGVFGGGTPARKAMLADINAQVIRVIFDDATLSATLNDQATFDGLKAHYLELQEMGITTIFCLRFPKAPRPDPAYGQDRIPQGQDRLDMLQMVDSFLIKMDTIIDYYQLQNEIMGGPGVYLDTQMVCGQEVPLFDGYNAFNWLDSLAAHARNTIENHSLKVKILSPSITGVLDAELGQGPIPVFMDSAAQYVCGGNHIPYAIHEIVSLGKKYCDALDIHLNVADTSDVKEYITYVDSVRSSLGAQHLPFITTEWCQAKQRKDEINQVGSYFNTFLNEAIITPVAYSDWSEFIDSLHYDTTFIATSFRILQEWDFEYACYNGVTDGADNLIFLPVALLPTHTVVSPDDSLPNEPFYSLVKNLGAKLPASVDVNFEIWPNWVDGSESGFENQSDTIDGGDYTVLWDFGDGSFSTESGLVVHAHVPDGLYTVTLTVSNFLGCSASHSIDQWFQVGVEKLQASDLVAFFNRDASALNLTNKGDDAIAYSVLTLDGKLVQAGALNSSEQALVHLVVPSTVLLVNYQRGKGKPLTKKIFAH